MINKKIEKNDEYQFGVISLCWECLKNINYSDLFEEDSAIT